MELIALAVIVALAAIIYYNRSSRTGLDLDGDGDVDLADAKIAIENTKKGVAQDAAKAKTTAKKAVTKVKTAAKKAAAKKSQTKPATRARKS